MNDISVHLQAKQGCRNTAVESRHTRLCIKYGHTFFPSSLGQPDAASNAGKGQLAAHQGCNAGVTHLACVG